MPTTKFDNDFWKQELEDNNNNFGYVVDVNSYELLYLNENLFDILTKYSSNIGNYQEQKCYKLLQNIDSPCEHCNIEKLELNKTHRTHYKDKKFNFWFSSSEILLEKEDIKYLCHNAYDITAEINEIENLKEELTYDKTIVECSETLLNEFSFEESVNKLIKIICNFYGAEYACIFERNYEYKYSKAIYVCGAEENIDVHNIATLEVDYLDVWSKHILENKFVFWYKNQKLPKILKETQYYKTFEVSNKKNVFVKALVYDGKVLGAIEVTNITKNINNHFELINTISTAIVTKLNIKNRNKAIEQTLEYDKKYFATLQNLSEDILFRIDLKTRVLSHNEEKANLVKIPVEINNFPNSIATSGIMHPDDVDGFMDSACRMVAGMSTTHQARIKVYDEDTDKLDFKWFEISSMPLNDENDIPFEIIGKLVDIQDKIEMKKRATTDGLTGCINKISFEEKVREILNSSHNVKHSLLFIDLDDFKFVNDNYGHGYGDFLLKTVAKRLLSSVKDNDIVGRVGGDEFIIFLRDIKNEEFISNIATRIIENVNKEMSFGTGPSCDSISHSIKCSIGISVFPNNATSYEEICDTADKALYISKEKGKNVYTFFDDCI